MNGALAAALYHANEYHQLVARNTTSPSTPADKPPSYKIVGLVLAISSGLFIGVSFVFKKYGLLKANLKYNEEAGEGYGYLKNVWWWGGMTLMILGEICNFAAYLFADAILVTPLGALSVVITAILSGIFLKERLSFVGKIGCFNCIVGAVVIAANAPEQPAVSTIQDMKKLAIAPGFLTYAGVIIVGCIVIAIWVAPKYGKKSMLVYLTVCSLIGGLSVVSIQGIGAAITAQARGIPQFNQWFLYIVIVFVISTLVTEIIYLNKALNLYNAALVTPTYYVYFTSATIVSDAVLYRGFKGSTIQILTVVLGFFEICSGVVLLQLSKSAKDVPDAAVFAGDLDQVRTVAEQEEPEYEPRADTMRGTAALLRAVSSRRQKRETKEVIRIKEEHMQPIGEDEQVEWDGLRRRRTISSPTGTSRPLSRRKTVHPPLGMAQFPTEGDDEDDAHADPDNGMHPGFWSHFKRKPVRSTSTTSKKSTTEGSLPMGPVPHSTGANANLIPHDTPTLRALDGANSPAASSRSSHIFGLPAAIRRQHSDHPPSPMTPLAQQDDDTAYHGGAHIHWTPSVDDRDPHIRDRATSNVSAAPSSPSGRRNFSFQNVFRRAASPSNASEHSVRPLSRSTLSFTRKASTPGGDKDGVVTEEERMGLVRGDTRTFGDSPPGYASRRASDEDGSPPPPQGPGGGKDVEGGGSGRAFV
ncbi:DUF803-domain-containing protein [Microthyrium microscopicum]|uniref:DUF803-domain-containing protein n=1 Tax=Microthyrium microscopicum TaxID=703497 RepID=A0A6A6TYR2_9PEZI|nr:DUF803-domain-containing protein [Microthyrium microscopicum]